MRPRLIPALLFLFLVFLYLGFVFGTAQQMPERAATHFGIHGEPDGWMSRSDYTAFMALMGTGLPAFIVVICFACRFFPAWMVNIPNRTYWLAPPRRAEACAGLLDHSLWLACLMICFFGALHYLTLVANRGMPVRMRSGLFFPVLGGFLLGLAVWVIALHRRFPRSG
jgi:hypothetical protein